MTDHIVGAFLGLIGTEAAEIMTVYLLFVAFCLTLGQVFKGRRR